MRTSTPGTGGPCSSGWRSSRGDAGIFPHHAYECPSVDRLSYITVASSGPRNLFISPDGRSRQRDNWYPAQGDPNPAASAVLRPTHPCPASEYPSGSYPEHPSQAPGVLVPRSQRSAPRIRPPSAGTASTSDWEGCRPPADRFIHHPRPLPSHRQSPRTIDPHLCAQ